MEPVSIQCVLVNGDRTQVAFIPEKFAKIGKILVIKGEPGWRVAITGIRYGKSQLENLHHALRNHRKATDI